MVELGADAIFVDCEHGTWSFEDVRVTAQAIRGAGGAAIVRPHSHERPLLIRYLNAGADGLMVPMVDTADQARAIVDTVRYACPADHEKRLVIAMIETPKAIEDVDTLLAVEGIDVFFIGPGDFSQNMGYPPAPPFGQPRPQAVMERVAHAVKQDPRGRQGCRNACDIGRTALPARTGCAVFLHPLRSIPSRRFGRRQEAARPLSADVPLTL